MNTLGRLRPLWALVLVGMICAGCIVTEPQIILQTRVVTVDKPPIIVESTRLVPLVVTATPLVVQPSPTPTPMLVRMTLPPKPESEIDPEALNRLAEWLALRAGIAVQVSVPANAADALKALCEGRADVAWLSIPAYIVAHETCGAQARFGVLRPEAGYVAAQFMVQSDEARKARNLKPIVSLEELSGKSCAFTDPLSLAGYLIPKAMLLEAGVKLGEEVFVGGDGQAVLSVYRGETDAAVATWVALSGGGALGDARLSLSATQPDATTRVKVLRLSTIIPPEPIAFRRELPSDVQDRMISALVRLATTEEGLEILKRLGDVSGLSLTYDGAYDDLRRAGKTLGVDWGRMAEGRYPYPTSR